MLGDAAGALAPEPRRAEDLALPQPGAEHDRETGDDGHVLIADTLVGLRSWQAESDVHAIEQFEGELQLRAQLAIGTVGAWGRRRKTVKVSKGERAARERLGDARRWDTGCPELLDELRSQRVARAEGSVRSNPGTRMPSSTSSRTRSSVVFASRAISTSVRPTSSRASPGTFLPGGAGLTDAPERAEGELWAVESVDSRVRRRSKSIDEHIELTPRDRLVHSGRQVCERTAQTHKHQPDVADVDVGAQGAFLMRRRDDGPQDAGGLFTRSCDVVLAVQIGGERGKQRARAELQPAMHVSHEHAERVRLLVAGTLGLLDEAGPHVQGHGALKRVTISESAAQRRDRDSRALRDLIERSPDAPIDEGVARRGQDVVAVVASIGAESGQGCILRLGRWARRALPDELPAVARR